MIWNQHLFTSLSAFYCFSGSLSKAIKTSYLLQENKGLFLEVDTPQITSCYARLEERVSHRCFYGAFLFHLELGLLKMLMLAVDDAQAHIHYSSSPLLLILSLALLLKRSSCESNAFKVKVGEPSAHTLKSILRYLSTLYCKYLPAVWKLLVKRLSKTTYSEVRLYISFFNHEL